MWWWHSEVPSCSCCCLDSCSNTGHRSYGRSQSTNDGESDGSGYRRSSAYKDANPTCAYPNSHSSSHYTAHQYADTKYTRPDRIAFHTRTCTISHINAICSYTYSH